MMIIMNIHKACSSSEDLICLDVSTCLSPQSVKCGMNAMAVSEFQG